MDALSDSSNCLDGDRESSYDWRSREPHYVDLGTLFCRVERREAQRKRFAPSAIIARPRALDAALLECGGAFERAWIEEVAALIALKRSDTPQARFVARRARARTARLAERIETARAASLAGLKVKARAILWRRHGEPLGRIGSDAQPIRRAE